MFFVRPNFDFDCLYVTKRWSWPFGIDEISVPSETTSVVIYGGRDHNISDEISTSMVN